MKFNPTENTYRKAVYDLTLTYIRGHNKEAGITYFEGVNAFSYLTQAEFKALYFELSLPACVVLADSIDPIKFVEVRNKSINSVPSPNNPGSGWNPASIDWTTVPNVVTPIKDQGKCGSCYAFSAVAAIESLSFLVNGTAGADLSEQQIVDCSGSHGNLGCNGGDMINAFDYVKEVGLTTEVAYPYKDGMGPDCLIKSGGAFKISGYTQVNEGDCKALAATVTGRPVAVGVDASNWQYYKNGTFGNCTLEPNHGVLLVGVNRSVWKIKNSWGTGWGEEGFIRLSAINGNNTCNVCFSGVYPNA